MNMQEFSQALGTMDPTELALGAGVVGAMLVLIPLVSIAWYIVSALGYFKMFRKAGQRGWMAFIPLLQDYVRFKMSWNTKIFWFYLAATIACQLFSGSEKFLLSLLTLAVAIALIVLKVKLCIRNAKSFGKTTGWGVLLFFCPFVVSLILGFGKAEYIGNTTAPALAEEAGV